MFLKRFEFLILHILLYVSKNKFRGVLHYYRRIQRIQTYNIPNFQRNFIHLFIVIYRPFARLCRYTYQDLLDIGNTILNNTYNT